MSTNQFECDVDCFGDLGKFMIDTWQNSMNTHVKYT